MKIAPIKAFYKKYHEIYDKVVLEVENYPQYYRGVSLKLAYRKIYFEKLNYETQLGKSYPYSHRFPDRKLPFPRRIAFGKSFTTAIWKVRKHEIEPNWSTCLISETQSPRLMLKAIKLGMAYRQFDGRDLHSLIDQFHEFFQEANSLYTVIVDEDISPSKNAFIQVAKQYNKLTCVRLHGHLGLKTGFLPLTADYMIVHYPCQKEKLVKWGLDQRRVIVE